MMFLIVSNFVSAQKSDSVYLIKSISIHFSRTPAIYCFRPEKLAEKIGTLSVHHSLSFLPGLCSMNLSKDFSGDNKFVAAMKNG